jgi:hypothetical protein
MPLVLYLVANIVVAGILEIANGLYGWRSEIYSVIYFLARPIELLAALNVGRPKPLAVMGATAFTWIAFSVVEGELTKNIVIVLLEGSIFMLAGFSLGFVVPFRPKVSVYGILAGLWLFLAVFDFAFAFATAAKSLAAEKMNEWWPSLACIIAFSWIGWENLATRGELE